MMKVDPRWGETAETLLKKALAAEDKHQRTRLMALSLIASGASGARVAKRLGKNRETIGIWISKFNEFGTIGLVSGWRGNPGRTLGQEKLELLKKAVRLHPREAGLATGRLTAPLVASYIEKAFGKKVSAETARQYLHLLGFSHKVPNKKLVKADPQKQEAFKKLLEELELVRSPNSVTVYVDEGQIWQDALPRKGWFMRGERAEVDSTSPGKKDPVLRRGSPASGAGDHDAGQVVQSEGDGEVSTQTAGGSAWLPDRSCMGQRQMASGRGREEGDCQEQNP